MKIIQKSRQKAAKQPRHTSKYPEWEELNFELFYLKENKRHRWRESISSTKLRRPLSQRIQIHSPVGDLLIPIMICIMKVKIVKIQTTFPKSESRDGKIGWWVCMKTKNKKTRHDGSHQCMAEVGVCITRTLKASEELMFYSLI